MTDLVEVLRMRNPETDPDCHAAADEIELLRAVVDAAKRSRETDEYGLLSVEKGWKLDRALAALEVDDEQ